MATVMTFGSDGLKTREFEVKNLGWLLAHKHEVEHITLSGKWCKPDGDNITLIVQLRIGGVTHMYTTKFAQYSIMEAFVNRRRAWVGTKRYYL